MNLAYRIAYHLLYFPKTEDIARISKNQEIATEIYISLQNIITLLTDMASQIKATKGTVGELDDFWEEIVGLA